MKFMDSCQESCSEKVTQRTEPQKMSSARVKRSDRFALETQLNTAQSVWATPVPVCFIIRMAPEGWSVLPHCLHRKFRRAATRLSSALEEPGQLVYRRTCNGSRKRSVRTTVKFTRMLFISNDSFGMSFCISKFGSFYRLIRPMASK